MIYYKRVVPAGNPHLKPISIVIPVSIYPDCDDFRTSVDRLKTYPNCKSICIYLYLLFHSISSN